MTGDPTPREILANRLALSLVRAPCGTLDTVLQDCTDEELETVSRIIERLHLVQDINWRGGGLGR